jgi:hypothetical protein
MGLLLDGKIKLPLALFFTPIIRNIVIHDLQLVAGQGMIASASKLQQ